MTTAAALLALLALAPMPVSADAADAADAEKVVIFERDLIIAGVLTPGFDVGPVYDSSYKAVEVRITSITGCDNLDGVLLLQSTPPVPIPNPGAIVVTFDCGGEQINEVVHRPNVDADQGREYPLTLEWVATGRARVHVQVVGVPWAFP